MLRFDSESWWYGAVIECPVPLRWKPDTKTVGDPFSLSAFPPGQVESFAPGTGLKDCRSDSLQIFTTGS